MKFKGQELSERTLRMRLRSFLNQATNKEKISGLSWYETMHHWCAGVADKSGIELFKVVGMFAALSPQMSVDRNQKLLIQYLNSGNASHYKFLVEKCDQIKEAKNEYQVSKILNGNKISAFYLNILHPSKPTRVTIDRHALSCLLQTPSNTYPLGDNEYSMTANQFKQFEKIYCEVSKECGILPHQLQAITWETYRRLRELKQFESVPF